MFITDTSCHFLFIWCLVKLFSLAWHECVWYYILPVGIIICIYYACITVQSTYLVCSIPHHYFRLLVYFLYRAQFIHMLHCSMDLMVLALSLYLNPHVGDVRAKSYHDRSGLIQRRQRRVRGRYKQWWVSRGSFNQAHWEKSLQASKQRGQDYNHTAQEKPLQERDRLQDWLWFLVWWNHSNHLWLSQYVPWFVQSLSV